MSDNKVELALALTDLVSGPAKRAADALRKVDDKAAAAARRMALTQMAAQKMNAALDNAGATKAARGLHEQAKAADKAAAAARRMGLAHLQASKMNDALDKAKKGNTFFGGFGAKLGFRSVADYAKGAFIGDLAAKGVETIIGGFVAGARAAVGLVTDGIKMAFVEGGKAENLRLSYKLLLGDKGGTAALKDIGGFAGKTKYDDDKIAEMMRPLFNAGLRGKAATSAFAASGDLEAAGMGDAQGFIDQFAKIQLKGGVTEKLLVGMGVNLRDFKTALAQETHIKDKEAAFKLASEGKADPQAIMNAIYRGIEARQGGRIGTGTEAASKTMSARLTKIGDLPSQYLKKMSESPAWQKLSDQAGAFLERMDPDGANGKKIVDSLLRVFGKIGAWVDKTFTAENIDRFASGVESVIEGLTQLPDLLNSIVKISEILAAIWLGSKIVDGIVAATGAAALVSAPLVAAAGALVAVAVALERINTAVSDLGGLAAVGNDLGNFIKTGGMPAAPGAGYISDSDFGAKYGGAGHQLAAPSVAPGAGRQNIVVNFHGDTNITAPPGSTAKETAAEFDKRTSGNFARALAVAATHGGG